MTSEVMQHIVGWTLGFLGMCLGVVCGVIRSHNEKISKLQSQAAVGESQDAHICHTLDELRSGVEKLNRGQSEIGNRLSVIETKLD